MEVFQEIGSGTMGLEQKDLRLYLFCGFLGRILRSLIYL